MDNEEAFKELAKEITLLAAEKIAIQAVLSQVFFAIAQIDPRLEAAVARGFDDAENILEAQTIQAGTKASPDHLAKSMKIVSELRGASLGRAARPKPKSGI